MLGVIEGHSELFSFGCQPEEENDSFEFRNACGPDKAHATQLTKGS